jgi:hypothetical protein
MLPNLKGAARKIHPLASLTVLLVGLFAGLALVQRVQDISQKAQTLIPEPNLVISPSVQTLEPGDPFGFSLVMNTGSTSIFGFEIELDFDPDKFEICSIGKGLGVEEFEWETNKAVDNLTGKIVFSAYTTASDKAVQGSKLQVLNVVGAVKSTAARGEYVFAFSGNTSLFDVNGRNVLAGTGQGTVTVFDEDKASLAEPDWESAAYRSIENFETYPTSLDLNNVYTKEGNSGSLALTSIHRSDGEYGALFSYNVDSPDHTGFFKAVNNENWTDFNGVRFWLLPDSSERVFAFRLREGGGEEWEGRINLIGKSAAIYQLPFNNFVLAKPVSGGNGRLDLEWVTAYGFYVHKGQKGEGSGEVYIDNFVLTSELSIPQAQTPDVYLQPTLLNTPTPVNYVASETNLVIAPPAVSVEIDKPFQLNTNIYTGGNELVGVELMITFDKNKLEATNVVPGGFFSNPTESIKKIDNEKGVITYSLHISPGAIARKGNGTLAVISFKSKAEGTTRVEISDQTVVGAINSGGRNALKSATGGKVDITKPGLFGDINEDGKVDILDYVVLFENFENVQISDPKADLNRDGKVNILDYVILFENFGKQV